MTRIVHVEVESCKTCPWLDVDNSNDIPWVCHQLDTAIFDPEEIDKECPLPLKEDVDV
jgi:hypothetical protein